MNIAPPTPKGFRDIAPEMAKRRRETIAKMASVLEGFGFVPLETPAVEFADTLKGKYGEEADKLIYEFEDRGGRKLALRYDLTVPLARFVASNLNLIEKDPFRRYQIGEVFRGENPQKGRWRQFTQFDVDSVGSLEPAEDAKIIAAAIKSLEAIGIKKFEMRINDRNLFNKFVEDGLVKEEDLISVVRTLDKIDKIFEEGVISELESKGYSKEAAETILKSAKSLKENERLLMVFSELKKLGINENQYQFDPTLARGLDYYTSTIFEIRVPGYTGGSVAGGGRYDNLIGMFAGGSTKKQIPAVGFAFGLDRIVEVLAEDMT